ncbi:MAG: glycosyltransferase family 4 protein [Dehalococcoidia bacterium]|nr:glycosyltransferase family 4 protein [Dehalococcoidia bacterium]
MNPLSIAFVIQRYGAEVTGGAEQHCRSIARRLAVDYQVTVLTTCALDHITWANHFRPGTSSLEAVRVLRFPVRGGRAPDFGAVADRVYSGDHCREDELAWLEKQGPNCPELLDHLRNRGSDYRAIVFYTYLYSPTALGLPLVADKAILVPTAHDEPPIHLGIFRDLFSEPRHMLFLTSTEERLVRRLFANDHIPGTVVGTGIDGPSHEPNPERFRERYEIHGDFLLYMGRIEIWKGCPELLEFFCRYKSASPQGPSLVLLGRADIPLPERPDIRALGFVSEEDKWEALAAATVLVAPSPYESLSIALLEAWDRGLPVLANGRCAVLAEQCLAGNGGLFYTDYPEFEACLTLMLTRPDLRETLGRQGRRYVQANYSWESVVPRWRKVIESVASAR